MGPFVYILGDHDEGGTTNAVATLDRARLSAMVETYYAGILGQPGYTNRAELIAECRAEALDGLARVLARSDDELGADGDPHPLGRGWGGLLLTVARLV